MSVVDVRVDSDDVALSARAVVKRYGGVHALKGVNFDIVRGKVTTLFGENGAGKSTLMKILSGVESPTSGEIRLNGEVVQFASSVQARDLGISIIHQELSLCSNLSVRDNIFMGRELTTPLGGVDFAAEDAAVRVVMTGLQEEIAPGTLLSELRLGQQQIVEIARALSVNSRILIMDEPTSALSATEVEVLFKVINDLTTAGVSIVYISHHLEEALQVTDYAVVLRDGEIVAQSHAEHINLDWIVENMVGRNFDLGKPPTGYELGPVALSLDGVSVADATAPDRLLVNRLSLDVRAGEIVCIYGLMGAGRTELLEAVAGRVAVAEGTVSLLGENLGNLPIADRIKRGLGLVPEDRQRDGLVQSMSVGHNLSLASLTTLVKKMFLSRTQEDALVQTQISDVRVKTDGGNAPIGSLSGGNQQKVVIGKMLATNPQVILLDEPSRGIDVGAKAEVFGLLAGLATRGLAVIYSTSEVGECLSIAHRIIVMNKGRIVATFGPDASKEQIMAASGEAVIAESPNGND
ncbi:sugar ABC transporter ATP-binding protein [Cryobacterium serini]|uniref:Sugar ABC transporter ATP-binding protein n=1 Tax=Cryobacterium serini TaxID=1259201 RepID=A0A4R9BVW8_9MICO|nr:sugar ABC transporter ATP-binding protein [Cryobacterium serini]TFD90757.1 sugar ABC transporter ATP-binding protein [Cryobacterium serini]